MINHELLDTMADGTRYSRADIVTAFRASTRQDLDRLRACVAADDCEAAALQAHRLRGASEMLGARGVANAARVFDEAAQARDGAAIAQACAALEREVAVLDAYLEALDGD